MKVTGYQVITFWTTKWGEINHSIGGFFETEEKAIIEQEERDRLFPNCSNVIIPLTFKIDVTPIEF